MASPKTQQKSSARRAATAHEKAVLKAAKARGLTGIDLRKPLSKYARSLVKKFEPVYHGQASVVAIPKELRGKLKTSGVNLRNGKAVVPKNDIAETARLDKKTGQIVVRNSRTKKARVVGRKQRKTIVFNEGRKGKKRRSFGGADGGAAAAAAFLAAYEDDEGDIGIDFDMYDEFYNPLEDAWEKA